MSKEHAKQLLNKVKELQSLKDDPRIDKKADFTLVNISNANWDMLQAMRMGVHYKHEFDCDGVPVFLRLLSVKEEKDVINSLMAKGLAPNINDNMNYLWETERVQLVLSKASTPHPVLKENEEPTLSLETLDMMTPMQLQSLGNAHADFMSSCIINTNKLDEMQLKEVISLLEKKPLLLKDLPFTHKVQVMTYLIEQLQTLQQLLLNTTMQS